MAIRVHPHDPGIPPFLSSVFLCLFLITVKVPVDRSCNPFMFQKTVHIKVGEHADRFSHCRINQGIQIICRKAPVHRFIESEESICFQHVAGHRVLLPAQIAFFPDPLFIQIYCLLPTFFRFLQRIVIPQPFRHGRLEHFQIFIHPVFPPIMILYAFWKTHSKR